MGYRRCSCGSASSPIARAPIRSSRSLLVWLPLTLWLLRQQYRSREPWRGAAAFSISLLVLLFIGRVFNNYYLLWPVMGSVAAVLLALERSEPSVRESPAGATGLIEDLGARSEPELVRNPRRSCEHIDALDQPAEPRASECEECGLRHSLRVCLTCGHVGCCDSSNGHATAHARETAHPVIRALTKSFVYCYAHREYF